MNLNKPNNRGNKVPKLSGNALSIKDTVRACNPCRRRLRTPRPLSIPPFVADLGGSGHVQPS